MNGISRRSVLTSAGAIMATPALARAGTVAGNVDLTGTQLPDEIERAVLAGIAAQAGPGCAVAVMRDDSEIYARGFGTANLETGTPVKADSVFRIGSLTKQFTAAAAIKLAAQGRLDLHAPVSQYLPSFKGLPPFSAIEAMHQTAGLHADEGTETVSCAVAPDSQTGLAAQIAGQGKPFDFAPGTSWLYSNANYIVLGAIIEQVTAKPLAEAMAELVFQPLQLRQTAFDNAADVVAGRVSGYANANQEGIGYVNAEWIDPSQAGGAGAMRSTVGDLCQWHHLLLSERLFDRAYVDLMLAPGRLRDGRLSSANRFAPEDANYGDTEYACGLLVSGPSEPYRNIFHYGAISGFCAVLQTWTESRVTFASLCNGDIGPAVPFRGIRKAVVKRWVQH